MRKALIVAPLLVGSIGVGLAVGAAGQDQQDVSALQESTTYNISGIKVQYPYQDPAVLEGDKSDNSRAGVTYTSEWIGSEYPGEGNCVIVLEDSAGQEVGRREFAFEAFESTSTTTDYEPVDVTGTPTGGWARCGDPLVASDTDGTGYVFGPPRIEETNLSHGTSVTFDVTWESDAPPGNRACKAGVVSEDGTTEIMEFGINYGGSPEELRLLPETPVLDIARVDITCHPPKG